MKKNKDVLLLVFIRCPLFGALPVFVANCTSRIFVHWHGRFTTVDFRKVEGLLVELLAELG